MEPAFAISPDLYGFYASRGRFIAAKFQQHMSEVIARKVAAGNARIIVNGPPRAGKSTITAFWTPLWFLNLWPDRHVVIASYGAALAAKFGRDLRNEIASNEDCGVALSDDSTASHRWNTPEGGGVRGMGVSGPFMGQGFHLGIISDPIKDWAEAHSPALQESLWDWFSGTFLNRAEPGASVIIDHTRWTTDDVTARVQQHDPERWTVLRYPALAEADDILGRKVGEALFPERYTAESYAEFQAYPQKWKALWQQRPDSYGAGRLYSHFDARNLDGAIHYRSDLPLAVAFDFNIDPGMHALLGQYDNQRDLFTIFDEIHGPRMDVQVCCRELVKRVALFADRLRAPIVHVFGDASGKAEWAGTSESCYDLVRLELAGLNMHLRVPAGNPPVRERLDTVNEALRDTKDVCHVKVHPRCLRLIDDFEHMQADEKGMEDKRVHALSHASSAAGYWITYMRPINRALPFGKSGAWSFGSRVLSSAPRVF